MFDILMLNTAAVIAGFILDFFLGDPRYPFHPVVLMGKLISFLDKKMNKNQSDAAKVVLGGLLCFTVILISTLLPALIVYFARKINNIFAFVLQSILCYQMTAARQLARESGTVQKKLEKGDIKGAGSALSMIVGRDTQNLDKKGICRAAVETVAENTNDGVIAPLLFMLLFGASGGFFIKAVNTLDSMLGYKNERYLYFGKAAAKADDILLFIPARISSFFMMLSCPILGFDMKNSWRIFKRDRYNHESPNSAQGESACAGALNIRLGGPCSYGGIIKNRKYIGDENKEITAADIENSQLLMYTSSFLFIFTGIIIRTGVVFICC